MRKLFSALTATIFLSACQPAPQPANDTSDSASALPSLNTSATSDEVLDYLTDNGTLPNDYLTALVPAVQKHAQLLNVEFNAQQTRQIGDIICDTPTALATFQRDYLGNDKAQRDLDNISPEKQYLDSQKLRDDFDGLGPEPHTTLPAMFVSPAQCLDKFDDHDRKKYADMTSTLLKKYKDK